MKLRGAILMIGSLFWEDEDNCIKLKSSKELAGKRRKWRESKLDMDACKLIYLPIRYGRKSTSRYCTYTMVFSNSVEKKGTAYYVPYKDQIDIEENFNQLYCQAIDLAKVEGISKSDENKLVKKWGSVGLKLNPEFETKNKQQANDIIEYWKSYFKKLNQDLYRIDVSEAHSITQDGLLNFELEGNTEGIDYFLATPVSPNIKDYPDGAEIAKAMNVTREEYYGYFVENYNNNIRTKDDEEIIKHLPEKIKASLQHSV